MIIVKTAYVSLGMKKIRELEAKSLSQSLSLSYDVRTHEGDTEIIIDCENSFSNEAVSYLSSIGINTKKIIDEQIATLILH